MEELSRASLFIVAGKVSACKLVAMWTEQHLWIEHNSKVED